MFSFLRNFHTIVHSGQHYTSNNSVGGVPFFHILVNSCFLSCVLIKSHSDRCEVISYCSFDLHLPDGYVLEHLFMCLLAICMSSLENAYGDLTLKSYLSL